MTNGLGAFDGGGCVHSTYTWRDGQKRPSKTCALTARRGGQIKDQNLALELFTQSLWLKYGILNVARSFFICFLQVKK